ncbi:alanyl (membrane) aminopeptidase a isoform X2 [Melanotaenia boesemani]|uniref:alanyl (membrane) aminopeptidase a isoform X2 n=1 Tax=Melanotaenia boesemani TaxID=1250792 RepID=UPI001C055998|nr:alanyl (membrane) aminopeptidase a isoform X2 [Melanotaenia boesemani]
MPQYAGMSKIIAGAFALLSASAITGLITMVIIYKIEIGPMKPTPRPTLASTTTSPPPVMRLPKNLKPDSYDIIIQPQLYSRIIEEVNVTTPNQTLLFTGNSTVHFHCVQGTSSIYLHSKDLTVSSPRVLDKATNEQISASQPVLHQDESNFLEIQLDESLKAGGNYSLFLAFEGAISDNLEGLYVSTYIEGSLAYEGDTNAERFLAATNLEPTDARRLFPCFDEPEMKAVFRVTIIHRRKTEALSNGMRSVSNIIDDDWKYTRFFPTPKMSTYLFAFTVSEFEKSVESKSNRVKIKTYARPEAIAAGHAEYAANITGQILSYFEDHLEIEYGMNKLDQIALPDLVSLAMENWGLVTYQEGVLLYEEGISSLLHKEVITSIIAHELAHQWFGNMVTMKWWNELWLNEGFATYMSYFAVDKVEPTFQIKDALIMYDLHMAFEEDALASSHPLSPPPQDVETTSEVIGMFDAISYSKGAMVLRMLADFVGERVFTNGIRMYLKTFKGGNTEQNDLWDSIQLVRNDDSHLSISKMMEPWTTQTGYPVITIDTDNGEIYQKRFLFNNTAESSLWWPIPIRYMTEDSEPSFVWLDVRGPVKKEEFISKSGEWILANINCAGYYRVNYNLENWKRLLTQLEKDPDRIPPMNRGQLVDDAFNLARAKLLDVALALNSTRFLSKERAYLPWESAERNLKYFVLMFDRSEVYGPMQLYLREKIRGLYDFFRNETDTSTVPSDHTLQHNQIIAIDVACSSGLPECIEMAQEKFAAWMDTNRTNSFTHQQ